MRRRSLLCMVFCAVPVAASAAIVGPLATSANLRHRLTEDALFALENRGSGDWQTDATLRADFVRLLGDRYRDFSTRLADARPIRRLGDVVLGEGVRPQTLGQEASLFVLGARGGMFVAIKGGRFGTDIALFGDVGLLADPAVRHRYLEFTDLDE